MPVHPSVFLDYGNDCINRGRQLAPVSECCFKAHFKLTHNACASLYQRLQGNVRPLAKTYLYPVVTFNCTEPCHLMWVLYHFYTNPTEEIGCSSFGGTSNTVIWIIWITSTNTISFLYKKKHIHHIFKAYTFTSILKNKILIRSLWKVWFSFLFFSQPLFHT